MKRLDSALVAKLAELCRQVDRESMEGSAMHRDLAFVCEDLLSMRAALAEVVSEPERRG